MTDFLEIVRREFSLLLPLCNAKQFTVRTFVKLNRQKKLCLNFQKSSIFSCKPHLPAPFLFLLCLLSFQDGFSQSQDFESNSTFITVEEGVILCNVSLFTHKVTAPVNKVAISIIGIEYIQDNNNLMFIDNCTVLEDAVVNTYLVSQKALVKTVNTSKKQLPNPSAKVDYTFKESNSNSKQFFAQNLSGGGACISFTYPIFPSVQQQAKHLSYPIFKKSSKICFQELDLYFQSSYFSFFSRPPPRDTSV
jgi:hypothetical protein